MATDPTPATVKRLFALSRNRCAFPTCDRALVREGKVTGKVCHIRAEQQGGPRYDEAQTDDERRAFENLILLCAECHDVIDDPKNLEKYSVQALKKIKEEHEQQAETLLTNEMIESFTRSTATGLMQDSALALLHAPNNSGLIAQFAGATIHGSVIVSGVSPARVESVEPGPTLLDLSGRLFRGRVESITSTTWVVRLEATIGSDTLDLSSTAHWLSRVGKHYVALARPGIAREFVAPADLRRDGSGVVATLAVRPEFPRTSAAAIGRDIDLSRLGEADGLTPGGLLDVPRVLGRTLSTGVGEWVLQPSLGSFIAAYARRFAADWPLLAELVAVEIARLAFVTADGAMAPSLTFVRGVNSVVVAPALDEADYLLADLDLDLARTGSWTGRIRVFVAEGVAQEAQRALDAIGESTREKCATCGIPAMGTRDDFDTCGNCGATAPQRAVVGASPAFDGERRAVVTPRRR